jgi:hypothetical protein
LWVKIYNGLTPRAPGRATINELNERNIGHLTKGNGEATPSSGPVALLVRRLLLLTFTALRMPKV